MSYNESLASRVRESLANLSSVEEKKMMGGLCFMVNDKMCVGIVKEELMCRIDPEVYDQALEKHGARPMDFTSRPMKGFVFVSEEGLRNKENFNYWIDLALKYNPKAKSSKSKKKKWLSMETYISILRGINVSGQKKVNMKELKAMYEELGFEKVQTYIQSGNVIFQKKKTDPPQFVNQIEKAISSKFGFDVPVIVRDILEWGRVVTSNPFLKENDIETDKLHVTFLGEEPVKANVEKATSYNYEPDRFKIIDKEVYVYCPNGYGNTKINNTFFESKLKVSATTRNWKTVNELYKLSAAY